MKRSDPRSIECVASQRVLRRARTGAGRNGAIGCCGATEVHRAQSRRGCSPLRWVAVAAAGLSVALAACSSEPEVDEVALILECFEHTGEADDPCPSGCAQVPGSQFRVRESGNGMCHIQGGGDGLPLASKFCAPGDEDDYHNGTGWEAVYRRLDVESGDGRQPWMPEDVRMLSPGQVPIVPGWESCGQAQSALCGCALQFDDE
jgi:hypothetical protein